MQTAPTANGQERLDNLHYFNESASVMTTALTSGSNVFNTTPLTSLKANVSGVKRSTDAAGLVEIDESDSDSESFDSRQFQLPQNDVPKAGKKTKGRVKIKMEFIENKLRRYTTFSKRKTGIMKKAYELSTLTGTQVMLLVASETGHVYTFATRKLQPMITSESGKALIQTCLNSPDPAVPTHAHPDTHVDQRMNPTGFEETELSYPVVEEDTKGQESIYPKVQPAFVPMMPVTPSPPPQSGAPSSLHIPPAMPAVGPLPQAVTTATTTSDTKPANISMHLPTGGITAILPASAMPPIMISPSSQNLQTVSVAQPQAIYRVQTPRMAPVLLPGLATPVATTPSTNASQPVATSTVTAASSTNGQVPQPMAVMSMNTSQATGNAIQPIMYQTPQGLVYAAPQSGIGTESYIINLPQGPAIAISPEQQAAAAAAGAVGQQPFITIPVSLANHAQMLHPILTATNASELVAAHSQKLAAANDK